MIKVLGILDTIIAIISFLLAFNADINERLVIILALYIFIKGIIFFTILPSLIDITVGILLFLSTQFTIAGIILIVMAALLLQKGILSIFS